MNNKIFWITVFSFIILIFILGCVVEFVGPGTGPVQFSIFNVGCGFYLTKYLALILFGIDNLGGVKIGDLFKDGR